MKNYKDYNKTYIGSSDSAYLTLKTITGTTEKLCFGEDGSYSAYVVDEDTLIPKNTITRNLSLPTALKYTTTSVNSNGQQKQNKYPCTRRVTLAA